VKTYSARFGIIPLTQKAEKLKNLEDVVICEAEAGSFKGFLVRGLGEHGQVARAQLLDTERELDIRFYFYGPAAANDSIVGPILGSLKAI
jgi:hypothetical protein